MCKLFIRSELANLPTGALQALFNSLGQQLVQSEPDTWQRRNALASLENIRAELRDRATVYRP